MTRSPLQLRRLLVFGSVVAPMALAVPAGDARAADVTLGPLVRITGPSPFTGCTADNVGGQPGVNYPNTEIEPWIASDPSRPRDLLVGWQQDRWSDGGARGLLAGISGNGGATWETVGPGEVTLCQGGPYTRASDPWVDFSPNGIAYYMHLAFDPDLPSGQFGANAMIVTRSTNGGATWGDPITLQDDPIGQILNDKNSLTANSISSSHVYAVWDRLQDFTLPPVGSAQPDAVARVQRSGDGVVMARERARQLSAAARSGARQPAQVFFTGPVYFARTTNGGQSWEPAKEIFDTGPNSQTIANQIVVPPSGTVIDFFTHIFPNGGTRIGFIRSFNRGASFGSPSYAATIATVFGSVTPDTHELVRDANILFDVAVDGANGNLYLVWQDVRFRGVDEVAFSMSTNGGATWSAPTRINRTPPNANPLREQAIIPSIEVGPGGILVATYYDYRNDRDNGREATDYFAVFCNPRTTDCRKRSSWGLELRLTNASFDMLNAPIARGYFLGDYMGLERAGRIVHPVFGIATGSDLTAVVTRRIEFSGAAAMASANAR